MILPLSASAGKGGRQSPVTGTARKGRRTKDLVKRLKPGDIAVIDHLDIDAIAAANLVDARVSAVIDCAAPISGKYPNRGPLLLVSSGIPLFQLRDSSSFEAIQEGKPLTVSPDGALNQPGFSLADAVLSWTRSDIEREMDEARFNLGSELEKFAENTLKYVREEKALLVEPIDVPRLKGVRTLSKRHVVIVVRGEGYRDDLSSISAYIRDVRPVLIGVDGGADVLREFGFRPDIILGDMDSVSDDSLKCGAKLVVHAYANSGKAPGLDRIQSLGLLAETFPVPGTSEDAAMLLAFEKGAKLIVAVGTHSNLEDFLDKGRAGMASTFLVRLRVGSRLVDARGVSQLHRRAATRGEMIGLILSGGAVLAAIASQSVIVQSCLSFAQHWLRLRFR
jgi:uncharacterized membrane-anchored protein